jgi:hypothetical protein
MSKPRILLLAAFVTVLAATGIAQEKCGLSVGSKSSPDEIETLLESGNPTLTAWSAYFAGYSSNERVVTSMLRILERGELSPPEDGPYRDPYQSCFSLPNADEPWSEILAALIHRKGAMPAEALSVIAARFPVQAVILAARLPMEEAAPLLEKWYDLGASYEKSRPGQWNIVFLSRDAAMLMSKSPPPDFAATVLADSEERLIVSVVSEKSSQSPDLTSILVSRGRCEDKLPDPGLFPTPEGEPPHLKLVIEENNHHKGGDGEQGHILVTAGGDQITYRSVTIHTEPTICYFPRALAYETRHPLLAEMLHVRDEQIPWRARLDVPVYWEGAGKFQIELQRLVDAEEPKLRDTVQAFSLNGLITKDEAKSIRPKMRISIYHDRPSPNMDHKSLGPHLPAMRFQDPRTSEEIANWVHLLARNYKWAAILN